MIESEQSSDVTANSLFLSVLKHSAFSYNQQSQCVSIIILYYQHGYSDQINIEY